MQGYIETILVIEEVRAYSSKLLNLRYLVKYYLYNCKVNVYLFLSFSQVAFRFSLSLGIHIYGIIFLEHLVII